MVNPSSPLRLLTEYPVIERLPTPTDYLWFPVHKRGDRILTMVPEKCLVTRTSGRGGRGSKARRVCVRHRKPHMMRHTFATDVLDATDGNLYAVQGLLGHSSTRVTETYLHSSGRICRPPSRPSASTGRRAPAKTSLSTMHKTPANQAEKGDERIRTAVRGFAGLCLTTRPRRPGRRMVAPLDRDKSGRRTCLRSHRIAAV